MPRKDVKPIQIHVPPGTRELITAHAQTRGMSLSEYVRRLVEADMRANGNDISLKVEPGGPRRGR
jgi:hypothetical protein